MKCHCNYHLVTPQVSEKKHEQTSVSQKDLPVITVEITLCSEVTPTSKS